MFGPYSKNKALCGGERWFDSEVLRRKNLLGKKVECRMRNRRIAEERAIEMHYLGLDKWWNGRTIQNLH